MKIAILTLPLHANYGGNLQAWALMSILKDLGHEVWLLDMARYRFAWWRIPLILIKRVLLKYFLKRQNVRVGKGILDWRKRANYEVHARSFINSYIKPRTEKIYSSRQLKFVIEKYNFSAVIVGSDQVWRPEYSPDVEDYFLGFLSCPGHVRRLSYAASFGATEWFYSPENTLRFGSFLRNFDAVSVREFSAVELCREKFGVDASHVIDPTMLLDENCYLNLAKERQTEPTSQGGIFVYFLDKEPVKEQALELLVRHTGFTPFDINGAENCVVGAVLPESAPVEKWIRGFIDADFIFTDSFHGCVFSIIFRKPFIAYGNPKRGLARFESLLKVFNLQNRLVSNADSVVDVLAQPSIDWSEVQKILDHERRKAKDFLIHAIGDADF